MSMTTTALASSAKPSKAKPDPDPLSELTQMFGRMVRLQRAGQTQKAEEIRRRLQARGVFCAFMERFVVYAGKASQ